MIQSELNRRRVMSVGGDKENAIPLTLTAQEETNISFIIPSYIGPSKVEYVEYSLDEGENWIKTINDSSAITITIPTLSSGEKVMFRGKAKGYGNDTQTRASQITATGKVLASGNIMSLLEPTNFKNLDTLKGFDNNTFQFLFYNCRGLISAPLLPAKELVSFCYSNIFQGCIYLVTPPELPCEDFEGEAGVYAQMFYKCTSLENSPILPAKILSPSCYIMMFLDCSGLKEITMLATDISANQSLLNWVSGVAATGTFVKDASMTTLPTGISGIPNGWTVEDYPN